MCVQAILAFFILLTFNGFTILLGVASLIPVAVYPFAKRFTWWPQVFLGIAFNWGALLGWSAHSGSLSLAPVLLYLAGIAWTLFYDTIYAHQDTEDDALMGVKSTARLFGEDTPRYLSIFLTVSVSCLGLAAILATVPDAPMSVTLIALAGATVFGWDLHRQLRHLNIDNPETCLRLFRANRESGLIFAGFLFLATFF
jgi:4-hydroxybenzoate polyprenyltransferase